jgi:protein farnesyltransferase/geranylgeranyltransferase type-1 subunit alpha
MDLFRAVLKNLEYSHRVLELTKELLQINPGSYTVWYVSTFINPSLFFLSFYHRHYRRATLKALQINLQEELDFLDQFADENPKNYQIWQHRRIIVELFGDASREKNFCERIFAEDAKNYHAWAHR